MAKFPGPETIQTPSIRPVGPAPVDRSYQAIVAGAQDLAQGLDVLGTSAKGMVLQQRKEENVADLAAAEAEYLKRTLAIGNEFDNRNDWDNFGEAAGMLDEARDVAAEMIRDPKMRESWVGDANLKNLTINDSIADKANAGRRADNFTKLDTALATNAKIISDPTAPEDVRRKAIMDTQGALIRAIDTNTATRDQAAAMKQKYLDFAEEDLAVNRGLLLMQTDPAGVMTATGIPAAMSGTNVAPVAIANGGNLLADNPALASAIAAEIGDHAFPTDPTKQEAYLSDPEIAERYSAKAVDLMATKYGGDLAAALIAIHPEGGDKLARVWMKGMKDDQLLPVAVRKFYHETLKQARGPAEVVHLPATADIGVEIADIDAATLQRFEQAQSQFGQKLLIVGGKRETLARGEGGLDVDVSKLNDADRARFVETASAMGFLGIKVSDKIVHLDMEERGFAPLEGAMPKWAEDVGARHTSGKIVEVPIKFGDVDPAFAKLPFEKRLRLYTEAKAQLDKQSIEMRGGIEIAEDNAPISIMNHGKYDGYIPTAQDYVDAYGAQDGLQKYEAFKSAIDTADTAYDMRTMSYEEIADTIDAAKPNSTGPGAFYEQKRYDALTEAAAAIKTAREKDPAGYVTQMMPEIGALYEQFGSSPEATKQALTAMDAAQTKLGILPRDKQLLPAQIVDRAVAEFNSFEAPTEQRTATLLGTIFATNDDEQRRSILNQFKKGGIPEYADMVFDAYARGDTSGAKYLMRAMLADPKQKYDLTYKDSEVDQAISGIYRQGGLGEAYYGLNGSINNPNLSRATNDSALLKTDVKLRLLDGSAKNLDEAVALATKDMFGNLKAVRGDGWAGSAGALVTVPPDVDEEQLFDGFTALLPQVAKQLKSSTDPILSSIPVPGQQVMATFVRDNAIRANLREGYFVNAGDGVYQFLTMDGLAVTNPETGDPLTWSLDDVKAAAKTAPQRPGRDPYAFPSYNVYGM
jgi:hypothetical protein